MKKTLMVMAALASTCGSALAQTSVTFFGAADAGIIRVTNQTKSGSAGLTTLRSGGSSASKWGMKGSEDLGGGMKASFWLEAPLDLATGEGGTVFFARRSTVSLHSNLGELRLGRNYTPQFWNRAMFDPFRVSGVGSANTLFSNLGSKATTLIRANQSIGYFLPPTLGGVYGELMVTADGSTPGNKHNGARLGYWQGPVNVAIGYGKTKTATPDNWQISNIGGSYSFGRFRLSAFYNLSEYAQSKQTNVLLGAVMELGAGELRASVQRSNGSGDIESLDATQVALGYEYKLSKRTRLYGNVAQISNSGTATYALAGSSGVPAPGKKSSGMQIGVNHSF